jgi:hypothetical protein
VKSAYELDYVYDWNIIADEKKKKEGLEGASNSY